MPYKTLFLALCVSLARPGYGQSTAVNVSGIVKTSADSALPFVSILLLQEKDSSFITGTISNENGRFILAGITPGNYLLKYTAQGYALSVQSLFVGSLSDNLDIGSVVMNPMAESVGGVKASAKKILPAQQENPDKKTYTLEKNIAQGGGSVLQAMQNLPGVTVQDGKIMIRGSENIIILIDGRQTALSGFGGQTSLDNIPASAVDRIEIIHNPSSRYDANGNAGIINIILKKNKREGFNGKFALSTGLGALWIKRDNLPGIRPQYQRTPKLNPSLGLNYRKKKINIYFQGDLLYNPTLNKNEFVVRTYDNGDIIRQQTKRNRNTTVGTARLGFDWDINSKNQFSFSTLASVEKILDNGDEPFFNDSLNERRRLWQFLEDEVKTTATSTIFYQHKYTQPGHLLNINLNYTYHRENEQYHFTNIMPSFTGYDAFKLLSDEHVIELSADCIRPLKYGRIEGGAKYRWRYIPTNMQFFPGLNSPLDTSAGGWATYRENIPAVYANYVLENRKIEVESGLRVEYVNVKYTIDPHNKIYTSNGYNYFKPFPSLRFAYKINTRNKLSMFYNRRVDRPNEFDIRVFPKYDDAEIIKIGNPALRPQYTNSFELGFKNTRNKGYFYIAVYRRDAQGTMTRIASNGTSGTLIYSIMQNAGRSSNTGFEFTLASALSNWCSFNVNINGYYNRINSFTVENLYPVRNTYISSTQEIYSGNIKLNGLFNINKTTLLQFTAMYLAPDLIPQGKIGQRFSLDLGAKKTVQGGKGEFFINASDLFNTMVIRREITADGFKYTSSDYYETQVIRIGYARKF